MLKRLSSTIIVLLALYQLVGVAHAQESFISWYFRGQPQQNNTVLTFNMGDTLNMVCKGFYAYKENSFWMVISKGATPPELDYTETNYYELIIDNPGTLIYDDFEGIQPGFENFVVVPGTYSAAAASGNDYRHVGIALLKPQDAGTYHCSGIAIYYNTEYGCFDDNWYSSSGGLTIVVNTKIGQAHSSIAKASQALTYSALILGASKLLF